MVFFISGNLLDEAEVLDWMMRQKNDESIEEIDRDTLTKFIDTKEFLAVIFCKIYNPLLKTVLLLNFYLDAMKKMFLGNIDFIKKMYL